MDIGTLRLKAFRCSVGVLVCPEFTALPTEARSAHPDARLLPGTFACGRLPPHLCERVRATFNERFYALLRHDEAAQAGFDRLMDQPRFTP